MSTVRAAEDSDPRIAGRVAVERPEIQNAVTRAQAGISAFSSFRSSSNRAW